VRIHNRCLTGWAGVSAADALRGTATFAMKIPVIRKREPLRGGPWVKKPWRRGEFCAAFAYPPACLKQESVHISVDGSSISPNCSYGLGRGFAISSVSPTVPPDCWRLTSDAEAAQRLFLEYNPRREGQKTLGELDSSAGAQSGPIRAHPTAPGYCVGVVRNFCQTPARLCCVFFFFFFFFFFCEPAPLVPQN